MSSFQANLSLILVTIQLGIQPFLTEAFVPRDGIKSTIVILQELIKSFCCILILYLTGHLSTILNNWTIKNSLEIALIPAIIYSTQNILAFYAYLNLDPLTFNLINQSKMIFAAIFLKLILNKTTTNRQIIALLILFISSIILTLDTYWTSKSNQTLDTSGKHSINGLIAVITASILSGIAGTLTQKALQKEKLPRNSLLFSTELAFYGILFSFCRLYCENIFNINTFDGTLIGKYGFLYNLDFYVLIPVTVNACGGIGIGLIIKYTSVIYKNYAFIGGILLSGIFRSLLYPNPMTVAMYVAVPLVCISLWLNTDASRLNKKQNKIS